LYRVRDATRLLVENGSIPPEFSLEKDKIFEELLVIRWHSYAEKYWKQRWVRTSLGSSAH
jgi:hypothetical protein